MSILAISFLNKREISYYGYKVFGTSVFALMAFYFPNPVMICLWILGCIIALWKQDDSLILVFFLVFSTLSISLTGWSSERLYYSLGWLMDGVTAWSIWMILHFMFYGESGLNLAIETSSTRKASWGKTGKIISLIAVGCLFLFTVCFFC